MAIDWQAVETAVQNWVEAGSGLADAKVFWGNQAPPKKTPPLILLEVKSLRVVGQDWVRVRDAADPEAGAEIETVVGGTRQLILQLSCIGGEAIGHLSSAGILSRVLTAASLPSVRAALNAAGVGVGGFGLVQTISEIVGSDVEPRAICDVRINLAEEISETTTYIERVEVDSELTGESIEIPEP